MCIFKKTTAYIAHLKNSLIIVIQLQFVSNVHVCT
nr:MAG TPA: hypothetical protein [Bacteriophage sp.]